ncbi:MAG TPA: hypothetical protein PK504_02730 [Ferruginibacter sp.]|nr:hypothetical protein [Ferruginibacter sp.]
MNKLILSVGFIFLSLFLFAQKDTTKIQTIDITSAFRPVLRNAVKINFYGSQLQADTNRSVLSYNIPQQNLFYAYQPITLKPLALAQDTNLYLGDRNFVKLGYGNYKTPYLSAGLGLGDGKKGLLNLYVDYIGSKGKQIEHQDYALMNLKAAGSLFTPKNEVYGSVSISSSDYNLYGYDHNVYSYDKKDVQQKLKEGELMIGIKNRVENELGINYNPSLKINGFSNKERAKETTVSLNAPVSYKINEALSVSATLKADFTRYNADDNTGGYKLKNSLFQLAPALDYNNEFIKAHVGITPVWNNDKFDFLPDVYAEAKFGENVFVVQGGLIGRYILNTYRHLSSVNSYLLSINDYNNTKEIELYGGIKATMGKHFSFSAKAGASKFTNLPLFINDTALDEKGFYVSNESKLNNFKIHGDLSYIMQEKFTVTAGLTFNGYTGLKNNDKAWHTVPLELNGSLRWWAIKKLLLKADFIMFRGIKFVNLAGNSQELDAGKDLSIGAEYKINKQFSAWVNANNLFNDKYQRWHRYNVYGTNVVGGIIFHF